MEHTVAVSEAEERLRAKKDRVLERWEEEVRREIPAAAPEPHLIIVNTVPAILDQLIEAFSQRHPRHTATQGSTVAAEHGGERVRLTHFRLEDLVKEYGILRRVLFEVLEEDGPLSAPERDTVNASVDQALMEACTGYALVQASFRDHFFAIVAHDIRTPLGIAHTNANLILLSPSADNVPIRAERILDNVSRVDRMLQDLLDAMRLQRGARLMLELEECDLADVVREALEHLERDLGDRLVFETSGEVRGHFARDGLRRAVENLVMNAVKYGSTTTPILVTLEELHGRALLRVHNHGAHIPAEEQETLFRAFQRASTATERSERGWGLGLAQVRAIAEAHGGSIGVDSVPGAGTTFVIDIPADARPYQRDPITPGS